MTLDVKADDAVSAGRVRVNGELVRPSLRVRSGDAVTLAGGGRRRFRHDDARSTLIRERRDSGQNTRFDWLSMASGVIETYGVEL